MVGGVKVNFGVIFGGKSPYERLDLSFSESIGVDTMLDCREVKLRGVGYYILG